MTEKTLWKTPQKTLQKTSEKTSEKMSEKIIALLRTDGSLSIQVLAEQIGKTTRTVERTLRQLRETGIIERIGSDKGGHCKGEAMAVEKRPRISSLTNATMSKSSSSISLPDWTRRSSTWTLSGTPATPTVELYQ
ncbi:MAG TPA: Lrp/AsnC family transcriptional regulator [Smithellaceae bacterium]|nr:Lrp/AsnC family transcriptional regulator [Smithellaceae bacterium]